MFDTVTLKLVAVGGAEDFIAGDLGGDNLADDVFVGKADDKTVLGGVVFILGLGNETLASVVVSLSCSTTLVLGLVAAGLSLADGLTSVEELVGEILTYSRHYS